MPKTRRWAAVAVALAALLAAGCSRDVDTQDIVAAAADRETARLQITYPQEGTLFPPDIVAPTFLWQDETAGADRWHVVVRDDAGAEVLRQTVDSPRWRPAPAAGPWRMARMDPSLSATEWSNGWRGTARPCQPPRSATRCLEPSSSH